MKYLKPTRKNTKKRLSTWQVDVAGRRGRSTIFKAKKSLGQNFLKSKKALGQIIVAGKVSPKDTVLEIGPGKGALTKKLLESGATVIAVEKDERALEFLKEEFKKEIESKKLTLIHGDVLKINIEKLFKNKKYKLIANIPYYITGEIMRMFLSNKKQPEVIVFLVQKEVAERIVAKDGKESILSISVKIYGEPKYIATVKKECFSPKPKVDSAILLIQNISKKRLSTWQIDVAGRRGRSTIFEQKFFEIVKTGFAHKRKVLSSNLKNKITKEKLSECAISEKSRAEDLSINQWVCLTKN